MVCLHWEWLLYGPHSPAGRWQCNQFDFGYQPALYHCIEHPVDHCFTGLHGQCRYRCGVPCSLQVLLLAVVYSQSIVYISIWLLLLPLPLQDHRCLPDHHQEDYCAGHDQVLGDFCDCTAHICWVLLSGLESWGDCEHVNWSHHIGFGGVQTADPVSSTCGACKYGWCPYTVSVCKHQSCCLLLAAHTYYYECMHAHVHECCVVGFCRYPWHVVFTGLRSLVEARGILDGNYFAVNDDGQYIGYQ